MNKSEQRITKVILGFLQDKIDKVETEDIENMMKMVEATNKAMEQYLTTQKSAKLYFDLMEIIVREIKEEVSEISKV